MVDFTFMFVLVCSMTTPNGRFMTQKKICLSMSDCKFYRGGFKDFFMLVLRCFIIIFMSTYAPVQFILKVGTQCGPYQG